MTRWTIMAAGMAVLGGAAAVALARALGWSGSRLALAVSVVAQWLGAWAVWGFAGHLAVQFGVLTLYEASGLILLAVPAGLWQYRTGRAGNPDRARAIFVGGQLCWLAIVLVRGGAV